MIANTTSVELLHAACVRLFYGNPTVVAEPNIEDSGWHPVYDTCFDYKLMEHLIGNRIIGVYPWVPGQCDCEFGNHTCEGAGARFLVLDIDDHEGEGDAHERAVAASDVAREHSLLPRTCVSRGGAGRWMFFFLDRSLPTDVIFDAAKELTIRTGLTKRCDIIPSSKHKKIGKMVAMPFSPIHRSNGGGIALDDDMSPVDDLILTLEEWDKTRTSADVISMLADDYRSRVLEDVKRRKVERDTKNSHKRRDKPAKTKKDDVEVASAKILTDERTINHKENFPEYTDARKNNIFKLLKYLGNNIPQLRDLFESGDKTDRSVFEIRLASILRRHGVSKAEIVRVVYALGMKGSDRGLDYIREYVIDYIDKTGSSWREEQEEASKKRSKPFQFRYKTVVEPIESKLDQKGSDEHIDITKHMPLFSSSSLSIDSPNTDTPTIPSKEVLLDSSLESKSCTPPPIPEPPSWANRGFYRIKKIWDVPKSRVRSLVSLVLDRFGRRLSGDLRKVAKYLVSEWRHSRECCGWLFQSVRNVASELKFSVGKAQKLLKTLAEDFNDLFDVRKGVSHPRLRIATSWRVREDVIESVLPKCKSEERLLAAEGIRKRKEENQLTGGTWLSNIHEMLFGRKPVVSIEDHQLMLEKCRVESERTKEEFKREVKDCTKDIVRISMDFIHPCSWNPNVMTSDQQEKLTNEIDDDGFEEPVIVTKYPKWEGHYMIISGEHRFNSAQALGAEELPCIIREWDDATAKLKTVRRNIIRGDLDKADFNALVRDLSNNYDVLIEDMPELMGFTDEKKFMRLYNASKGDYESDKSKEPKEPEDDTVTDADIKQDVTSVVDAILNKTGLIAGSSICFLHEGNAYLVVSMDRKLKITVKEFSEEMKDKDCQALQRKMEDIFRKVLDDDTA